MSKLEKRYGQAIWFSKSIKLLIAPETADITVDHDANEDNAISDTLAKNHWMLSLNMGPHRQKCISQRDFGMNITERQQSCATRIGDSKSISKFTDETSFELAGLLGPASPRPNKRP